jgi:hypothetical protein
MLEGLAHLPCSRLFHHAGSSSSSATLSLLLEALALLLDAAPLGSSRSFLGRDLSSAVLWILCHQQFLPLVYEFLQCSAYQSSTACSVAVLVC